MITLDWSVMKYLGKKLCSLSFHYLVKMFKIKYCSCSIFYEGVRKVFNVNIELRVYLIQMFNKFSESRSSVQSSRPWYLSFTVWWQQLTHPNTAFISAAKDEWPSGDWLEECHLSMEPTVSKHKRLNREWSNGRSLMSRYWAIDNDGANSWQIRRGRGGVFWMLCPMSKDSMSILCLFEKLNYRC